jgi:hypothetical protein
MLLEPQINRIVAIDTLREIMHSGDVRTQARAGAILVRLSQTEGVINLMRLLTQWQTTAIKKVEREICIEGLRQGIALMDDETLAQAFELPLAGPLLLRHVITTKPDRLSGVRILRRTVEAISHYEGSELSQIVGIFDPRNIEALAGTWSVVSRGVSVSSVRMRRIVDMLDHRKVPVRT